MRVFYAAVAVLGLLVFAVPAGAAESAFKACGREWQQLKSDGKQGDQTWLGFLKECRARHDGDAGDPKPASDPQPAAAPTPAAAPDQQQPAQEEPAKPARKKAAAADGKSDEPAAPKELSEGQKKMRARQEACAQEWHTAKDAGKVPDGQKWPQFWSACNKRLKDAGQ